MILLRYKEAAKLVEENLKSYCFEVSCRENFIVLTITFMRTSVGNSVPVYAVTIETMQLYRAR